MKINNKHLHSYKHGWIKCITVPKIPYFFQNSANTYFTFYFKMNYFWAGVNTFLDPEVTSPTLLPQHQSSLFLWSCIFGSCWIAMAWFSFTLFVLISIKNYIVTNTIFSYFQIHHISIAFCFNQNTRKYMECPFKSDHHGSTQWHQETGKLAYCYNHLARVRYCAVHEN